MMNSGIYCIRHKESGREYIGRSVDIHNRWALHKRQTERRCTRAPLHRALRKYGYNAFDWIVLVKAPARVHVALEAQFIMDRGSMVPAGYNVGGAAGGQPSRELVAAMGEEEREQWLAGMRATSAKMHARLEELRKDPEYEVWYRKTRSDAAKKRWAERKARMASDPIYAEEANRKWLARAQKAAATIRERQKTDPDFARHMFETRSAIGKKARANDPRTLRAKERAK